MTDPSPIDPRAANSAGMAALQAGDFGEAVAQFTRATAADPGAIVLWRNLASAHRGRGDDAGERAALDAALAIDRTDLMSWLRLAQLHQRRGEAREGLTAWSGVRQLAAGLGALPDEIGEMIAAGAAWADGVQAGLSARVDEALGDDLARAGPGERRRMQAFLDHATKGRPIYVNECAGLHYPFLPADEFFDDAHFPWFAELAADAPAIRAELEALLASEGDAALRPYVRMDDGTPENKWSALDRRLDWGAAFLWEYGQPNAPLLARCPATAEALGRAPLAPIVGRSPSAFFSLLKPRTRIPPHTGVTNTRAIIHLPLIVPEGCGFRVGGETRAWVEGRPFAFDDTIEHEAWNDSNQLRAVLIFDVWNPHLTEAERDLIARYYAVSDEAVGGDTTAGL